MYFDSNRKNECSGCGACANICPVNAITMKEDVKGFLYPVINDMKCTSCNLCRTVCPNGNEAFFKNPIKIYACINKKDEIRSTSSSGGIFAELANTILDENGVVYGAIFSDENNVEHSKAQTKEELEKIKKSKYVQSNTKNIYKDVKEEVKNGRKILFSGTPCQVQSLRNNITVSKDNMLLVDVVCHGVPSPKIFEDYKIYLEKKYNSKIKKINFRYKNEETTQNIKVDFEDGKSYISNIYKKDIFFSLFIRTIILRESCYNCQYKSFNRGADISLADFWGYDKGTAKDFGDNNGISLVLINTKKGMEAFDKIKDKIQFMEIKREECEPYNCFFPFKIPDCAQEAWDAYFEKGIEGIAKFIP